jgi:hypothetical protein
MRRFFQKENPPNPAPVQGFTVHDKQENSHSGDFISILRTDMLPASETSPSPEDAIRKINFKIIFGIIFACFTLGLFLFLLFGGGKSFLEERLSGLMNEQKIPTKTTTLAINPTMTFTATQLAEIARKSTPTLTLQPQKTEVIKITSTQVAIFASDTPTIPATFTPTPTQNVDSGCRDALSITLADVGKTMCVQGVIKEIIVNQTNYMLIFDTSKGAFYWVTYDVLFPKEEVDVCYQVTGSIDQIANSPILIFNYANLPEECP